MEHEHEHEGLDLRSRRGLLAGGAALAGAALAKLTGPDSAVAGHNAGVDQTVMHLDVTNTTAGSSRISSNIAGTAAFVGLNNYPVGISRADGILGRTAYTASNCAGAAGASEAANGGIGVLGTAKSATGTGVYGFAGSSVPSEATGGGVGVYGKGPRLGVLGRTTGATAVQAEAPAAGTGVYGYAGTGLPTEGAPGGTGVFGRGPTNGVVGRAAAGSGVQGETETGSGVRGRSLGSGTAVLGTANASGLAGRFVGRTVVDGEFEVVGGPGTTLVRGPGGTSRRLYSHASTQPWVEAFGVGKLVRGRATVRLDEVFDALVPGRDYLVFLTEFGNQGGLYVARRRGDRFHVRARRGRRANGKFAYRVVAQLA